MNKETLHERFNEWLNILRLKNHWDVKLECIEDKAFKKTGDFKVDPDDKKAIIIVNTLNPKHENLEEVIVHELMHLKLYPLDQLTENIIDSYIEKGSKAYDFAYQQFMLNLEQTVEELTKCFLLQLGSNKDLSYGRVKSKQGYNALYDGLKPYGKD